MCECITVYRQEGIILRFFTPIITPISRMLSSASNEQKNRREKKTRRRDNGETGLLTILEQMRLLMYLSMKNKTKDAKKELLDAKYDHVFVRNLHIFFV